MLGCATQNSVLHHTSLDLNVMAMCAAHTHVHIAVTARIESMSTHSPKCDAEFSVAQPSTIMDIRMHLP